MVGLLINLVILVLILGVVWWIITLFPLPEPFPLIIRVVFVLILVLILIDVLTGFAGVGWRPWWRGYP
jgi:hypothetical protein